MKKLIFNNLICLMVAFTVLISLNSCTTQKSWVYSPDSSPSSNVINDKAVVMPFIDSRLNENKQNIYLYMVPLMPFGSAKFSIPEGSSVHANSGLWTNYNPKEDFAKALAQELTVSNTFNEAYFSYKNDEKYSVKGEIINTDYQAKFFSYCLSIYGPVLWFLGAPATKISNSIKLELSVVNNDTGVVMYINTYEREIQHVSWIYKMKSDFNYSDMITEIYKEFLSDFRTSQR